MKRIYRIIILILTLAIISFSIPQTIYSATTTQKIGDINGDGKIDIVDTMRILEHIAASTIPKIRQKYPNWILKDEKLQCADINGDGVIDQIDTLRELEYIAATTVPKIGQKRPEWRRYIESRWKTDVTEIIIEATDLVLEKGQKVTLKARVIPTNATNKVITWSSSDIRVASVDGLGTVTAVGKGITIITARTTNGVYKTIKVEVRETTPTPTPTPTPNPPTPSAKNIINTNISLKTTSFTYNGRQQTPEVIVKDGNTLLSLGKDYVVSYTNNINAGTANVIITGKGNYTGTTTRTFKINKATYNTANLKFQDATFTYDGKAHSITAIGVPIGVSVTYIGNNKINVGQYSVTAKFTVNANYNPISDKTAKLTITQKSIANLKIEGIKNMAYTGKAITQNIVIKDGNIVLKNGVDYTLQYKDNIKVGNNAKVIITGKGNYTGTITKTFTIGTVKATKIVTTGQTYRLVEKGQTVQLSAKVSPDNATYKTITWTSSNPKVVTVNSAGKINVIGHGTVKITATQKESNVSATYTIVGYTPPKSISLSKTALTLNKGSSATLTVTFNPTTTSSKEVNWKSSNPNVVSVSNATTSNGKITITAKAKGTATITATHKYGKTATCKVTVNVNTKVIYVAKNGSDSNAGTASNKPLKTIKKGISKLSAGYTLMVNAGTYYENDITISKKGTSSNPIKIVANGNVILDGSGKKHLIKIKNSEYITIQGFTFQNLNADDAKGILIEPSAKNIVINNCKFNNIKTKHPKNEDAGASAIFLDGYSSTAITGITISNCTLTNIGAGYSEAISIDGNCTNLTITGVKVTYTNGLKGNIGICVCGNYGTCSNKSLDRPRNVTISNCNVSNCKSPYDPGSAYGIYVDGGQNVNIYNNTVTNCEGGIEIGAEEKNSKLSGRETENIKVYNNTINNCGIGAQIGGWDGKATVYNVLFDNNKLLNCGHNGGKAIELSKCKKVTISNCKFNTSQGKWFENSSMAKDVTKKNNTKI